MIRAASVIVFASATFAAHAQDYKRVAPKLPSNAQAPALAAPAASNPESGSEAPLNVVLKKLVFVTGSGETSPGASAVDTSQVPALNAPEFAARLTPFLGRPLTLAALARIKAITQASLRERQRPFVDVSIPPQNIASGVVRVIVTQYKLGKLKVEGARYFSPALIRQASGLESGQTLRLDSLQSDLDRLNRNPFLNVDAVFEPGGQTGETDVTLKAKDRLPLRGYIGYDNLGVRSLGLREYNAGVNWGNAFGTGQIVSYQMTRTFSGRYTSHSVSDAIPLPWGDQLLIFGSYGIQRPFVADIFNDEGHSGQASARYVRLLPRMRGFTQDLQLGYDFKTTDNNLEFAGFQVFGVEAEVDQFPLIYDASRTSRFGHLAIQNIFVYSPGGITPNNNTAALSSLVPGARAKYLYDRFLITQTTPLPKSFSAVTRITLQGANHNLPYSEQIGGGGVGSVRGYYTDTAFGSKGEMFSQELRLPPFAASHVFDRGSEFSDKTQFGVFFDYADLRQVTPIPDLKSPVHLASAGVLARYSLPRSVDVQFDFGWRLESTPSVPVRGAYGQISLATSF